MIAVSRSKDTDGDVADGTAHILCVMARSVRLEVIQLKAMNIAQHNRHHCLLRLSALIGLSSHLHAQAQCVDQWREAVELYAQHTGIARCRELQNTHEPVQRRVRYLDDGDGLLDLLGLLHREINSKRAQRLTKTGRRMRTVGRMGCVCRSKAFTSTLGKDMPSPSYCSVV